MVSLQFAFTKRRYSQNKTCRHILTRFWPHRSVYVGKDVRIPENGHPARRPRHAGGLQADVFSYSAAISACEKAGEWRPSLSLLSCFQSGACRKMTQVNMEPLKIRCVFVEGSLWRFFAFSGGGSSEQWLFCRGVHT